jgi:hypothetical protein
MAMAAKNSGKPNFSMPGYRVTSDSAIPLEQIAKA